MRNTRIFASVEGSLRERAARGAGVARHLELGSKDGQALGTGIVVEKWCQLRILQPATALVEPKQVRSADAELRGAMLVGDIQQRSEHRDRMRWHIGPCSGAPSMRVERVTMPMEHGRPCLRQGGSKGMQHAITSEDGKVGEDR